MRKTLCLMLLLALLLPMTGTAEGVYTPSARAACDHENCYWTLPMDISDAEAVWAMLTAPMTVLSGDQKKQVSLLDAPNGKAIGEITCYSQGVHVIGGDENGWTKVEAYSSSFSGSRTKAWNQLLQGYVQTSLLTTVTPSQHIGMVVDKLTQRLYLFVDGKLLSTLRVSTGLANASQPYNETRSGEYLLVSQVGSFQDGRMVCEKAIRFNNGDLLHQVPYYQSGTDKDYERYEPLLGQRASHGCIRVQRKRTPEGINMTWINDHYEKFTKIVIWEDWEGRAVPQVPADTLVYYTPKAAQCYHRSPACFSVRDEHEPMQALRFDQLQEGEFASMTPCVWCNPPEKPAPTEAETEE